MEKKSVRVLIVEFNPERILAIKKTLSNITSFNYEVSFIQKEEDILNKIEQASYDALLLSYDLGKFNGLEILEDLKYKEPKGPVIMIADSGDEEFAVQAMREGAYDYVIREKGYEDGLPIIIHKAIGDFLAREERERLQREIAAKNVELEAANKKLRELDRIKSDFVSNVAHEFRTPLTIIKGNLELVQKGSLGEINQVQIEALGSAHLVVNRLSRLVNDLLDLSKIESGKMELKRELVNLNEIAKEAISSFEKLMTDKRITKEVMLSKDISMINVDKDKIVQVFINLISNAIKYTPEGGKVAIKTVELENEIQVEISDSGEGIAPENIDKIFDKFTRVTAEKKEGTGLGLPIAKDIVTLHNGRMWAKSELKKGSQFYFTLPK